MPQHQRLDKAGRQDTSDEQFAKALRVKRLVCHILEAVIDLRLLMRLSAFLESLRRTRFMQAETLTPSPTPSPTPNLR